MRLHEVMNRRPVTIQADEDLALALQTMLWCGVRHLPVMHEGRLVGLLSERDVLARRGELGEAALREPVSSAMRAPVHTAAPDDPVAEAAGRMSGERIGCLPVLERGDLVGIVTTTDLLATELRTALAGDGEGHDLTAGVLMTPEPLHAASDDLLMDAVARMSQAHVRHLPVVDGDMRLVGIVSDRDVRTALGDALRALEDDEVRLRMASLRVADVMTREPRAVGLDTRLHELVALLGDGRVGALCVVDGEGRLAGILSYVDVLHGIANR